MDEVTIKEAKALLEDGHVDKALLLLKGRVEPTNTVAPHFFGLMVDFRSLPNNVATALQKNDFSKLGTRELMDTLFFLRNTIKRTQKSHFLTTPVVLALSNMKNAIQMQLETGE